MRLLATTGSLYHGNSEFCWDKEILDQYSIKGYSTPANVFRWAQWTSDGSSLITINEDKGLRLFVVPPNILETVSPSIQVKRRSTSDGLLSNPSDDEGSEDKDSDMEPKNELSPIKAEEHTDADADEEIHKETKCSVIRLMPLGRKFLPSPILCASIYPQFNLQDFTTQYTAVSIRDVPIRLFNILSSSYSLSSSPSWFTYGILKGESYMPVYAMSFNSGHSSSSSCGLSCGSERIYAFFDLYRPGTVPLLTIPSTGIVSALAHKPSEDNVVATGCFDGTVSLYDLNSGFSVLGTEMIRRSDNRRHSPAVMQLVWSYGENYIFQVCRNSPEIDILDIRMSLHKVAGLKSWHGRTNQRLNISVNSSGVYGGGSEGRISIWRDAEKGIDCFPSETFLGHDCK